MQRKQQTLFENQNGNFIALIDIKTDEGHLSKKDEMMP
jgi:hypothetical protein